MIIIKILQISPIIIIENEGINISRKRENLILPIKLNPSDFFVGFEYTTRGYYIRNAYLNDITQNYHSLKLNIIDDENLTGLTLKIDSNYTVHINRLSDYSMKVLGYTNLHSERSFLDWIIIPNQDNISNLIEKTTDYRIDYNTFKGRSFVSFRKPEIFKIPLYLGNMSDFEISRLHSIESYPKLRYTLPSMNNAFNEYLSNTFSKIDDCIIPYEAEERMKKISQIISLLDE